MVPFVDDVGKIRIRADESHQTAVNFMMPVPNHKRRSWPIECPEIVRGTDLNGGKITPKKRNLARRNLLILPWHINGITLSDRLKGAEIAMAIN